LAPLTKGREYTEDVSEEHSEENKRDDETEGCKKLCNDEIHNFCSSSNIFWMIKSRRINRLSMWQTW
jgi:hypothetical protein